MLKEPFNDNWIIYESGCAENARPVSLPHDAMMDGGRSSDSAGRGHISWFKGGDYVYEKTFFVPEEYRNKVIFLEFEGVYRNAEIYINTKKAGGRACGYSQIIIDATPMLVYGKDNTITVTVKNSDQPNSRWYTGSGIYRPVNLYVLPKHHIDLDGVKITTLSYNPPLIEVAVIRSISASVTVEVLDGDDIITTAEVRDGEDSVRVEIPNARLWSPETPALYDCRLTFGEDIRTVRFGIRTVSCDSKNGFLLNGKRTLLLGACVHSDNGAIGAVAHPFADRRKIQLIKDAGFNAIRSAHNPCSVAMLDACDELGIMVLDEYADMWYIHKNKYDYAKDLPNNWRGDLKSMVDKDYNHPSVVMYSIGNEVAETGQKRGIELSDNMATFLRLIDNRPVTCGINTFFNFLYSKGFGVYSDKKADKESKKKKQKAVGSEFFNRLAGVFGDRVMKLGARLFGDGKSKKAFATLDVAGYNYGILRYKKDVKKYPDRVILGTETFCKDAPKFMSLAEKYPAVIGDFVWAGMDYLGEVGIGSWVHEPHADNFLMGMGWMTAGSGRIDITGKANAEMGYMRVAYGLDIIRMAVKPVHCVSYKHSPSAWKFSGALESWNYPDHVGCKTTVEVYTKAPFAILYLNGKKLAVKRAGKKGVAAFDVRYRAGQLTAVAADKGGKELARTTLKSGDSNVRLQLTPEQSQVKMHSDLIYVRASFTDGNGSVLPYLHDSITISVENGKILGFCNACPFNARGYQTDTQDAYYGEALAIIRPCSKGVVKLHGKSIHGEANAEVIAE